jgi:hypothetical protein
MTPPFRVRDAGTGDFEAFGAPLVSCMRSWTAFRRRAARPIATVCWPAWNA